LSWLVGRRLLGTPPRSPPRSPPKELDAAARDGDRPPLLGGRPFLPRPFSEAQLAQVTWKGRSQWRAGV
jgi:hypothetical protein